MALVWIEGARPKTLIASISPVCIGAALTKGSFCIWTFTCILMAALLIQIGTNYANDYFDFKKGADQDRIGPRRILQAGLVSESALKNAIIISFSLAAFFTLFLILKGGWFIAALLVLAIALGILYTGGPFPLAYLGLGDFFVFLFFGPIATLLTAFLLTSEFSVLALIAGLAPGAFSTGILAVNNLRDRKSDQTAGKQTLVVRFGHRFGVLEYQLLMLIAFCTPLIFSQRLCCIVPFLGLSLGAKLWKLQDPSLIAPFLQRTSLLLACYTLLFCLCL